MDNMSDDSEPLSKEAVWFVVTLILLLFCIGFAVYVLIYVVAPSRKFLKPVLADVRSNRSPYSLMLPLTRRGHFSCMGMVVEKNLILTSSPCVDHIKEIKFAEKTYEVTDVYGTNLTSIRSSKKPTLINGEDLQLKLLKVSGDLRHSGLSIVKLPPLNYALLHSGLAHMLYLSKGRIKKARVNFIHPYYCHMVYKEFNYTVDNNSMICAIMLYENLYNKLCLYDVLGSPLIQNNALVGVLTISAVLTCGEVHKPFVFLNIISHLRWFDAHISHIS